MKAASAMGIISGTPDTQATALICGLVLSRANIIPFCGSSHDNACSRTDIVADKFAPSYLLCDCSSKG